MNNKARNCQLKRMRGNGSQNEGFWCEDSFPRKITQQNSVVVSERPKPLKLHYANKFHEPPGVGTIYNIISYDLNKVVRSRQKPCYINREPRRALGFK